VPSKQSAAMGVESILSHAVKHCTQKHNIQLLYLPHIHTLQDATLWHWASNFKSFTALRATCPMIHHHTTENAQLAKLFISL
jgi:hypothetical protein